LSNSLGMRSSRKKSNCARSHIGKSGVHRRRCVLPARSIETELNKWQKLVERLVFWRASGKPAGQVIGAVLKGQAPVQCFDDWSERALELAVDGVEAKRSGHRAERQFVHECASDGEGSQPSEPIGQIAKPLAKKNAGLDRVGFVGTHGLRPGMADAQSRPADTSISCWLLR
jgi:hypothetical protein